MKPPSLRWLGITAAAAAAVLCWYLLTVEPGSARRTAGKFPAAASVTGRGIVPWPAPDTQEFKKLAKVRALPWLDARGRDAAGLVAMWDLTGDESFLTEAAGKSPDDPRVCIAMIGHEASSANAAKALPWIERLLAAEPQNPHAWHLKAWAQISRKDQAGALAALQEAAAVVGTRESMAGARADTVREAALASGISPGNAARLAIGAPLDRMTSCRVTSGIHNVILTELKDAQASGDEARLMKTIGLGLVTAESISAGGPVTLREARAGNTLALALLTGLPGDTELGPAGRSVASLTSELQSRYVYLEETAAASPAAWERLRTASDDIVTGYADCLLGHGEQTALSSLPDETPP